MKKITLLIITMALATVMTFAQTPDAFNYQAVARTSSGAIMATQNISVEISIMESGSAVYTETHNVTTNQYGLFTLQIGGGVSTLGDFSTIDWANGSYSVQTSMDENAGTNFVVLGTSPLLTVPYAMHAKTAENTFSGEYSDLNNSPDLTNYDTDVTDDFSGNYADLSGVPTLTGDVTGDIDNNTVAKIQGKDVSSNTPANDQVLKWNDAQQAWLPADDALGAAGSTDGVVNSVGITGTTTKTVSLTRSNGLGTLTATFDDDDTQLTETEVDAMVNNNGYLTSENDGSTTNELQDLSISGSTLSIENGNSVSLASVQDGYEANTDNQTIALSGNNLSISNGNSINISSIDTDTQLSEAQVDSYVANNGYLTSENDGSTTNELQDLSISGTTLSIENGNSVDLSSIGGGAFSTTSNVTSNVNGDTNNDDFIFGSSSYSTGGNKIYFEKSKGAFRMGDFTGTAWTSSNTGINSTAMGYNAKAKGDYSAAFGYEVSALEYASFVVGRYNIESAGLSGTWNDLLPLFVVGNGTSSSNRNNALTVLKSGNVGIGIAAPDDALDVSGNLHVQDGTFQYEDGNEASGKVLMSSYNGTASWESLPQNLEQVIHPINGASNERQMTGINSTSNIMGSSYSVTKNLSATDLEIEVMGYIMIENYNLTDWIFIDLEFTGAAGAADHGIERIYISGADASESATVYIPVHFKAYWSGLTGGTTYNLVFKARTASQTDSDAVLTMLVNGFGQMITAKEFRGN